MRFIGVLLVVLFVGPRGWAQVDDAFWFVAPEVTNSHGDDPVLLRFATFDEAATVTVSMPAGAGAFPEQVLAIPANDALSLDLTPWLEVIENKPFDGIHNKGLRIVSSAQISAYYEVNPSCGCNPDIFALKGANAEGTSFFIPFQTFLNNSYANSPSGFDVVATEPNTTVSITPTEDLQGGHLAGVTYEVYLPFAGSTYSARAVGTSAGAHAAGTVVVADRPIAVTIHDDSANGAPFGGCSDLMGDQLVPVEVVGQEYIAIQGYLNGSDRVYVLATEDATEVSVDGVVVAQIDAGETHSHTLSNDAAYLTTSAPAYLWHLTGFGCEVGGAVLPSIDCTGSPEVVFVRSTSEFIGLNVLVPSGGEANFTFNGDATAITAADFQAVPGTGGEWMFAQVEAAGFVPQLAASRLANSSHYFHLGIVHGGASSGTRYGYFSDYGALKYQAFNSSLGACVGDEVALEVSPIENGLYEWTGPNGFADQGESVVTPPVGLDDAGPYVVQAYLGECAIENDTVWVEVHEYAEAPVLSAPDWLCAGEALVVVAQGAGEEFAWTLPSQAGANVEVDEVVVPSVGPEHAGTYAVQITDNNCPSPLVSIDVAVITTESLALPEPELIELCSGAPLTYDPDLGSDLTLTWTFPTGEQLTAPGDALLQVEAVTSSNAGHYVATGEFAGCPMGSDSIEVSLWPTPPAPTLTGPPTPCEGDAVTLTAAASGAVTWVHPDGWVTPGPTWSTDAITPADLGTHTAFSTSPEGCASPPATYLLEWVALPSEIVTDWAVEVEACQGVQVELGLVQYDLAYDVEWTFEPADGGENLLLDALTSTPDFGPGTYTIDYATGPPCNLTATGVLEFAYDPCTVFIPNVISPGNGDSRNDAFRMPGLGAFPDAVLRIFNRWGGVVFEHFDFGQSAGWAPRLDEASEGTYFWTLDVPSPQGYLSVETVDGVAFYGEPGVVHLTGSFTLVR